MNAPDKTTADVGAARMRRLGREAASRDADMERLQRKLAYSAARSDIECCALRVNDPRETPARWDVAILDNAAGLFDGDVDHYSQLISDAVQYLDWLGLLARNGEVSSVVTIKDLP